jgi:hypothetical protein
MTYMIGYQDVCNCNLETNIEDCSVGGICTDFNLDVSCSAMLQGIDRYIRMEYWMEYLAYYYGQEYVGHRLIGVNVGHDPEGMIASPEGLCEIFGYGCFDGFTFNQTNATVLPELPVNDFDWF